jgi:ferritin
MEMVPALLEAFNKQISIELRNSIAYLQGGAWLRANGWGGTAKYFKNNAEEEHGHTQNFIEYVARRDQVATVKPVDLELPETTLVKLIRFAADLEDDTETEMRALVKVAEEVGDDDAVEYVSGKLVEQTKSAKQARDLAKYFEAAKDSGTLVLLDRELENKGF